MRTKKICLLPCLPLFQVTVFFICPSRQVYGENVDHEVRKYLTSATWNITGDLIDLLIQCFLSTVPLEWVVRLSPQEMQDGRPLEGWYVPGGHKLHVLFSELYEPAGQSAAKDSRKKGGESKTRFTAILTTAWPSQPKYVEIESFFSQCSGCFLPC